MGGTATGLTVGDFWQWSASDLLGNTLRGLVAEYLVAVALNATVTPRVEWNAYDVVTEDGLKVEVKSSAYLQSWKQLKHSQVSFSIRETLGWDESTNTSATTAARQSDVYVFCLLAHRDKATVDPLNLDQWRFYVLDSRSITTALGSQASASLATLERIGARQVPYRDLEVAIRATTS